MIFITRLFFCDFSHSQISRTSYAQVSKTYTQTQLFSRPRPWACSRRWSAESTMCIGAGIRSFAVLITAIVVFAARATAEPFELRILPLPAAVNESLVGMTYPLSSTRNIWSSLASSMMCLFGPKHHLRKRAFWLRHQVRNILPFFFWKFPIF